ncbi:NAD(P)H-dependent oxidoreductase [Liquorilactobacillus satsumensis]|uniref:NAD(P)H-dependent oxidoreductase n=1 Tax=Liquorilactobacillus satsumensis TaxID=259059 RepID=UPI0021C2D584|nr:NAD(P)H-dependent oxidoreductase [Liquorilactobacillus satsumensis]MCP9313216.1 NAD(P)H-dependent oxidoreductase [Liquorilactobacillus satsumensis]MCP9360423.1 NAD(P)H-dependent oxidoreductase [Liquorilactobacillus satsumensis]
MKTIVIVAHPTVNSSGTQQFLKEALQSAQEVKWHPLSWALMQDAGTIVQERRMLHSYTRIIFQFPLYWHQAPALLHFWLEKVLQTTDREWLAGKELGLVVSLGRPLSVYRQGGSVGVSLSELLSPFSAIAHQLQLKLLPFFEITQFYYLSAVQKQCLLIKYLQYLELEQPATFAQQEEWFVKRFRKMLQEQGDTEVTLPQKELVKLFQERAEELAELKAELALMKEEDED